MLKPIRDFALLFKRKLSTRRAKRQAVVVVGVFLLVNIVVSFIYQNRTYPNTVVAGHRLGSVSAGELTERLQSTPLLPKEVSFTSGKSNAKVPLAALKVQTDLSAISRQSLDRRSWLPVANLVTSHDVPLQLKTDQSALQSAIASTLPTFQFDPVDAKIERQGDSFSVKADKAGQKVDTTATGRQLVSSLESGATTVNVVVTPIKAAVQSASLQKTAGELNAQLKTAVSLRHGDQSKSFSRSDIAGWYVQDKASMALSESAVNTAVATAGAGLGITVQNQTETTAAIKTALHNHKDLRFELVAAPPAAKTLSYCTAVRGVDTSEIPTLAAKLKQTFNDNRGWNLGGLVGFSYDQTATKCDFTVWLSEASQMPTFGAICDSEWSCAVSPNVVINYDRWRYASTAWNAQGGSLEDYRAMVINHESGHWFGFNHASCPGPGQAAPVMQQQSIDLQGCAFNPWPTASEQAVLKQRLGL